MLAPDKSTQHRSAGFDPLDAELCCVRRVLALSGITNEARDAGLSRTEVNA